MVQTKPMAGKFPRGHRLDVLGAITFAAAADGYQAVLDVGHSSGERLRIPAAALDSYAACRKTLFRRHAVRLVLREIESCRRSQEARKVWPEAVAKAIAGGRK